MPTRANQRARRVLAVLLGLSLVAACTDGQGDDPEANGRAGRPSGRPVRGGTLVDLQNFAAQGDPHHIDPALADSLQAQQPGHLLFDGLTENDFETGQLKPMVARSYVPNDDATVWTFALRDDVRFSNGDPVLPSDFKFAWERAVQPQLRSELAYHFDPIKGKKEIDQGTSRELTGVTADDAGMTLRVELNFPYSAFPLTVSHLVFSPVPRKVVQALPEQGRWEEGLLIGNGPFVMQEPWRHEQSITLARNEGYWGGLNGHRAYLDRVVFKISKDVDSAFADFEAGNGQTGLIPPGRFAEARARYGSHMAAEPTLGTYFWVFNMRDPAVGGPGNKALRRAIAAVIDRRAIVDTVYNGARRVATALTPPNMPGYADGLDDEPGLDLAAARRHMREYGRTPPPLALNFNAGSGHEPVAAIVQANLKDIGIESRLDPRDSTTYASGLRAGTGQFFRSGWIADYVAYDNFTYPLFHTGSIGGDNLGQYSNPQVDALIDDARRTLDQRERDAKYRQVERLVLDDQVVIPLNWYAGQIVYDRSVRNLVQSPLQFVAYDEIFLEK